MLLRFLLLVTRPYSMTVWQPVETTVLKVGGTVHWFRPGQPGESSSRRRSGRELLAGPSGGQAAQRMKTIIEQAAA